MQKIAIHSVPRSGSTWLGNIFNSHPNVAFRLQPLFSYAFKNYLTPESTTKEINIFFNKILHSEDEFITQKEGIKNSIIPEFSKSTDITHCCYKEVRYHHILENMLTQCTDLKLILIVRNPLAALYSWYKAPKEFRAEQGWIFEDEWLDAPLKNLNKPEEYNGYNKWKEATRLFLKLRDTFPKNVVLISYKDLIKEPTSMIKMLFEFVGLTLHKQTEDFILKSTTFHQSDAYSVFKIKESDDAWKALPSPIINYILDDLKGSDLEQFLNE